MTPGNRIIEITINPKGETRIQTKGFAGASCRNATRDLEKALGLVQTDQPTAELYQSQPAHQQQEQRQ